MLDEVVRLGQRMAFEGRLGQVVQAFEAAPLEQFGQAALQGHLEARVSAEGSEHAAGARIHQGHAHHREFAAQRGVLDQYREALLFQAADPGEDARVLGQHLRRHVRQRQLAFEDLPLDRTLEDLRQALHLRLGQGIAGAHAVAEVEVLDQVGGEIHHLAVGLAHEGQGADTALHVARVGVVQVRAAQLAVGVVDRQAMAVEQSQRQRIVAAGLEPAFVRVMDERRIGDLFSPVLVVVEEVAVQPLDEFAQRRGQRAFLARALAVGEAHRRLRIADVQRPDVGHDVAPGGDLDLHAEAGEDGRQVGDGLLQRQVLARDARAAGGIGAGHQQRLGVGIEVVDLLDDELGPGLHHLLHRAAVDGAEDALAVLLRDVGRQFHLDLEDLPVAVLRVDDVVLRQAYVVGGDVARLAVQLDEVGGTQRRRRQEVVERPRRGAVALVADRLVGDHREIIEPGFQSKVIEKIDLYFHGEHQEKRKPAIIRELRAKVPALRRTRRYLPASPPLSGT